MDDITNKPTKTNNHIFAKIFGVAFAFVAIVIIFCMIGDIISEKSLLKHQKNGDWEVVSTQTYFRDGQKCIGYRVYVDRYYGSASIYKDIFIYLKNHDEYYLHTVWIYNLKSMADGSSSADYIMEQTSYGEIPDVKIQ